MAAQLTTPTDAPNTRLQGFWLIAARVIWFIVVGLLHSQVLFTFVSTLITALLPLTVGFSILRYRLYDIDLVIRKTVQYAIISGLGFAVYLLAVGATSFFFSTRRDYVIPLLALIIVFFLFRPLKEQIEWVMDRVLPLKPRVGEEEIRD